MQTEKEFTIVYNTIAPKVYRLCLGYASGDIELAKEWQQETFIKVWNHRKTFKNKASIDTWIYRIAVNTCLADLRKPKHKVIINESILANQLDTKENSKDVLKIEKMYRCIDQLTQQNKTLIFMGLENIPQAVIAKTVGLAHGTLRTRLNRIRQSLFKCITNGK